MLIAFKVLADTAERYCSTVFGVTAGSAASGSPAFTKLGRSDMHKGHVVRLVTSQQ